MRPRHYTAENLSAMRRGLAIPSGFNEPRHYTAENHRERAFLDPLRIVASMRPRHYTAENFPDQWHPFLHELRLQ